MIRLACIVLGLAAAVPAHAVDNDRLLDAIREREGWHGEDGPAGERGPYQITAGVWAQHMPRMPFSKARLESPARACALKHVAFLARALRARGVAPTVFNLALAWNAGLGGTVRNTAPASAREYASAVENLYHARSLALRR